MASEGGSTSREDCTNESELEHCWGIRTTHRSTPSRSYPLHCIVIALVVVACPPSSSDLEDEMMKRRALAHNCKSDASITDAVGRMR
ncbi:hypothetical protein BDN70DRAFT_882554 [Pholiota conissans]|uniref:Uncharacterized protein n=1 Tax=Pholiota conissans TaxID=109636 RepID=A0A9P5YV39_9AGAR|nr:hypothetical protein BDN70DRAFT_882554 [Pholiota conissans]